MSSTSEALFYSSTHVFSGILLYTIEYAPVRNYGNQYESRRTITS